MTVKQHFCEQRRKLKIHIEQLHIVRNRLAEERQSTLKIDRQLDREERRLALLDEIWDV